MADPRHSWLDEIRSLGMFGRAWIVGLFAFSAARALIAWPTFGHWGVNPWLFLLLDLVTAIPYAVSQAVTVKILHTDGRPVRDSVPWAVVVLVTFFAPYVYIVAASGEMPSLAYIGLAVWIAVFGVLALYRMRKQVLAGRAAAAAARASQIDDEPERADDGVPQAP